MRTLRAIIALACLCVPDAALARTSAKPPDLEYGEQETEAYGDLEGSDYEVAPVDSRAQDDPLAGVGVMLPNATLTRPGELIASSLTILGLRASWGVAPEWELASSILVSPRLFLGDASAFDSMGDVLVRRQLWRDRNLDVTLGAALGWRSAPADSEGAELGVGVTLAADLKVSDTMLLGVGLGAYAPAWHAYSVPDDSGCLTRDDLGRGECVVQRDVSLGAPAGGRFVSGWLALTSILGKGFTFKLEAATGASVGSALGVEAGLWGDASPRARSARALEERLGWGAPSGAPLSFGAALGWSSDSPLAAQLGVNVYPGRTLRVLGDSGDNLVVLPLVWVAYRFSL